MRPMVLRRNVIRVMNVSYLFFFFYPFLSAIPFFFFFFFLIDLYSTIYCIITYIPLKKLVCTFSLLASFAAYFQSFSI